MGAIGGTLTGPLIFILPPLFYRRICQMEKQFDEHIRNEEFGKLMMDSENGSANDDKLYLHATNTYGTFNENANCFVRSTNLFNMQLCYNDSLLSIAVMAFGLIATFASTYFNLLNVSSVTDFWSPCINNISNSFRDL